MKHRSYVTVAVILTAAAYSAVRAHQVTPPPLAGDWVLDSATGTTRPEGLFLQVSQSPVELTMAAQWTQSADGRYGLTLTGLLAPEMRFSLDGREDLNQAGPFVIRSKTAWSGPSLVTTWRTTEYLGIAFEGRWVRSVSPDGQELTISIEGTSSNGQRANAVLKLRRFSV